jgi:hypothetical protein
LRFPTWRRKAAPAVEVPLSEATTRRPDFVEGIAIRLANGEAWHFPKPVIEFRLRLGDGKLSFPEQGRYGDGHMRDFGPEYWSLFEAACDAADGLDRLNAYATLAVALLRRNYDLTDTQVIALLPYCRTEEPNQEMWNSILEIAMGLSGGKPEAVGTSSS